MRVLHSCKEDLLWQTWYIPGSPQNQGLGRERLRGECWEESSWRVWLKEGDFAASEMGQKQNCKSGIGICNSPVIIVWVKTSSCFAGAQIHAGKLGSEGLS